LGALSGGEEKRKSAERRNQNLGHRERREANGLWPATNAPSPNGNLGQRGKTPKRPFGVSEKRRKTWRGGSLRSFSEDRTDFQDENVKRMNLYIEAVRAAVRRDPNISIDAIDKNCKKRKKKVFLSLSRQAS